MPSNLFINHPVYDAYDSFRISNNERGGICYGGWASDGAVCLEMVDTYKYKSKVYIGL